MGIDAAGEAVTGALLGRAVEPHAGEGHDGAEHRLCLNCGTALIGPHCHRCGQSGHVHRSISAIGHEILHGVVHFEGKLWRTLPLLAWRPGELTRRYIEGERARFVSPMALFLFSIFFMFAVFSMAGLSPPSDMGSVNALKVGVEEARRDLTEQRGEAVADRARAAAGSDKAARADQRIARIDAQLAELAEMEGGLKTSGLDARGANVDTGIEWLDHGIVKMAKNPSLALYKLQSNSYKFSWLLIPLSLPFMWLLFFWKRQYGLYDHMVFVTYSIAFMSLLFIAITVLAALGVWSSGLALAGMRIPIVHVYRQLKDAYRLRRWSAVLRTLVLLCFVWMVLTLFLLILLALGAMG